MQFRTLNNTIEVIAAQKIVKQARYLGGASRNSCNTTGPVRLHNHEEIWAPHWPSRSKKRGELRSTNHICVAGYMAYGNSCEHQDTRPTLCERRPPDRMYFWRRRWCGTVWAQYIHRGQKVARNICELIPGIQSFIPNGSSIISSSCRGRRRGKETPIESDHSGPCGVILAVQFL